MLDIREELLHRGQDLVNQAGWVGMNNQEIADKLRVHADDFEWLFETSGTLKTRFWRITPTSTCYMLKRNCLVGFSRR